MPTRALLDSTEKPLAHVAGIVIFGAPDGSKTILLENEPGRYSQFRRNMTVTMTVTMCKCKIHRATVTEANLDYVGSITIDESLMKQAGLLEFEQVSVANITTGERFETYVIKGDMDSGVICINGAAAHKARKGDLVIIIAYAQMDANEAKTFVPRFVFVDSDNRPVKLERETAATAFSVAT